MVDMNGDSTITNTDTSAEALERLRKLVAMHGDGADDVAFYALLAERDRLKAEREAALRERDQEKSDREHWQNQYGHLHGRCIQAEAERDAARAALAALPDYPPHDPVCSVTDVLREAIAKAKDL